MAGRKAGFWLNINFINQSLYNTRPQSTEKVNFLSRNFQASKFKLWQHDFGNV